MMFHFKQIKSFVKIFPGVAHGWTVRYNIEDEVACKRAEEAHDDLIQWFTEHVKWIRPSRPTGTLILPKRSKLWSVSTTTYIPLNNSLTLFALYRITLVLKDLKAYRLRVVCMWTLKKISTIMMALLLLIIPVFKIFICYWKKFIKYNSYKLYTCGAYDMRQENEWFRTFLN